MPKATNTERSHAAEQRRGNGHEAGRDDIDMLGSPIEAYATLMREVDHLNRVWFGSMRQTLDAGYSMALQLSQAMIEDSRRLSERWLNLYDRDRQVMSAFGQDLASRTQGAGSQLERTHMHAAEQRQAAE